MWRPKTTLTTQTNPSDHLLHLVSTDFGDDKSAVLDVLYAAQDREAVSARAEGKDDGQALERHHMDRKSFGHHLKVIGVLSERNVVNYSRNLLAYGVRMGMYLGMG